MATLTSNYLKEGDQVVELVKFDGRGIRVDTDHKRGKLKIEIDKSSFHLLPDDKLHLQREVENGENTEVAELPNLKSQLRPKGLLLDGHAGRTCTLKGDGVRAVDFVILLAHGRKLSLRASQAPGQVWFTLPKRLKKNTTYLVRLQIGREYVDAVNANGNPIVIDSTNACGTSK